MLKSPHPEAIELAAFLESPQAGKFTAIRSHIAECANCREQLRKLERASSWLLEQQPRLAGDDVESAGPSPSMRALVGCKPESGERPELLRKLKDNPADLKAALHFVSNRAAFMASSGEPESNCRNTRSLSPWIRQLIHWRPAAWVSIPATAALVLMLTLSWHQWRPGAQRQSELLTYRDDARIYFARTDAALPGIGFFQSARDNSREYPQPRIGKSADDELQIDWQPIADAMSYSITLIQFLDGEETQIATLATTGSTARMQLPEIPSSARYEWRLEGKSKGDVRFIARGGLIIVESNGNE